MADKLNNDSDQNCVPKSSFKLNPEAAVFAPSKRIFGGKMNFQMPPVPVELPVSAQPSLVTKIFVDVKEENPAAVDDEEDEEEEKPAIVNDKEKSAEGKAKEVAEVVKEEKVAIVKGETGKAVQPQAKNKKDKIERKPENLAKPNPKGEAQKSKAELRAERRAVQEAQRAVKAAATTAGLKSAGTGKSTQAPKAMPTVQSQEQIVKDEKKIVQLKGPVEAKGKKVQFFSHLQQFKSDLPLSKNPPFHSGNVHPAIIGLGLQYAKGVVCGSNARCIALLHALKQVINDYETPANKELPRDFEERLKPHVKFLQECRPLSVSMENVIRMFKRHLTQIPNGTPDGEAKQELVEFIDRYIDENICKAYEAIAMYALTKINDGDVILVFSHSSAVNTVLVKAHARGTRFHVMVIDSKPQLHGLKTVARLVREGIECTYALVNTLSYTMQKVTKVFLGAHALLSNGYVMARAGTAMVALVAKAYNVPVLVCCETHKFSERVHTDSFVYNELGNPEDLIQNGADKINPLSDWREVQSLDLLNLVYDVTPPDLVSAVITELGMLPCTSVPVVLRLKTFPQKTLKR